MTVTDPHIKSEKRGALGLLTLDRPQALNALTHGMVTAIADRLTQWAQDADVRCVVIRGEGDRAFCAGGDIRAVQQAVVAGTDEGAALLRDEYHMNALIGAYPKPYVALLHGISMGGGAGLSVHGRYRLADGSLTFAMPETGIGFIPDVGASYFLSRLPCEMGLYLGLTASSIGLADALDAGLMTHAVQRDDFDAVLDALANGTDVDEAITPFVRKPGPGPLREHRRRIQTIFSASSVEAILERLDRDGSDFAQATAQVIRSRSPTSLKLVFRQLREGAMLDLKGCLAMEYRLALRVLPAHDFREGVRAALVDKDRRPQWQPSSLAGVGDLDAFFAPLGKKELFEIS
ncbi:MAG TPA: enoyl-CoA hydratase/isomerase family protein [Rhizomicrobium sp.]|nr:enoyl-CoA hydratase/isomerase family protein [Rhizomicrobium sp.]